MRAAGEAQGAELHARMRSLSFGSNVQPTLDPGQIAQTLTAARSHVEARKKAFQTNGANSHVQSAATMLDRTLCLASDFNKGGATLSMFADDVKAAGHYIRSFDHDLLISNKSSKDKQAEITGIVGQAKEGATALAANAGLIPNVQTLQLYQKHKGKLTSEALGDRARAGTAGSAELYDASLKYRTQVTQHVAGQLAGTQHIKVGAFNDYPAVMVHFDARGMLPQGFRKGDDLDTPAASFNEFLMSHYLGIVNAEAAKMGLNTATVERSSFGHLTPSVAATGDSFRINLGMMPPAYAEAHVQALKILDQELSSFKASLGNGHSVDRNKFALSSHSGDLGKAGDILQLAFTRAESTGKTLMTNTVRTLKNRNAVDGGSYHKHMQGGTPNPIGETLAELFSNISFTAKGDKVTMSTTANPTSYDVAADGARLVAGDERMDVDIPVPPALATSYGSYLDKFSQQFADIANANAGPDGSTHEHMKAVASTLHVGNPDIATALDLSNQMLMVHTLEKMQARAAEGAESADLGYGSGSDIEDDTITGSKLIVHNGMRSLLGATDSARALLVGGGSGKVGIAYDHPYYETPDAIKKTKIDVKDVKTKHATADIVIKDINACVTNATPGSGRNSVASDFPAAKAWIIDATSATTSQMHNVYQQFKDADNAELLYFVSSGLKNEQAGADQNNYGTVRVFAKSADISEEPVVGKVMGAIAETDKGLAQFSHEHRRTMKAMGLVPTNSSIVVPVRSAVVDDEAPFGKG
ncbi:hypothetical protein C9I28_25245 [Pseudoduganella armeniaca]|uniref:Uncharacterized protein n=2 Tax=Pseudoduganella armeniaca TaxID=2072590 RepID=A0A2R4CGI7_9BURK|nr:hypothetical protein C9I28_25245 [Pseudoduganella armeniaca]